ncbi:MAG: chorismate mutase, partial [Synechococcaceae cyanobacterium]|nr:chorismate mutase [Synechococcaceae cyanobacterium]
MSPPLELRALRGATTATANTCEAIGEAVSELIDALMAHN